MGDLRLDFEAELQEDCNQLVVELSEGLATYRFLLPGPASAEDSRPSVMVEDRAVRRDPETGARTPNEPRVAEADEAWRARAGSGYDVRAQNLDDRLQLYVDGDRVWQRSTHGMGASYAGASIGASDIGTLVLKLGRLDREHVRSGGGVAVHPDTELISKGV